MVFRLTGVLFRLTKVVFRLTGVLFRLTKVIFTLIGEHFSVAQFLSLAAINPSYFSMFWTFKSIDLRPHNESKNPIICK